MAWRASHGVWYGLAGLALYIVWSGGHCMVLWYVLAWDMVWPCGHRMVQYGGHRMVYGIAWRASHGMLLWPGRQGMGLGIACGMAWRA